MKFTSTFLMVTMTMLMPAMSMDMSPCAKWKAR